MSSIDKLKTLTYRLFKDKADIVQGEDTLTVTFRKDIQFLAFVAMFGKVGVGFKATRPGQVVKLGQDFVYAGVTLDGLKLHITVDRRGFMDQLIIGD